MSTVQVPWMVRDGGGYILTNPEGDVAVPQLDVPSYVMSRFDTHGHRTALICGATGRSYSYSKLRELVDHVTGELQAEGLLPEDTLVIWCSNCPEVLLLALAAWQTGLTVALVSPLLTQGEVQRQLELLGPKAIFAGQDQAAILSRILPNSSIQAKVVLVNGRFKNFIPLSGFLERPQRRKVVFKHQWNLQEDAALIIFSSGTTGPQKAVVLTHASQINEYHNWSNGALRAVTSRDHVAVYQPLSHALGLSLSLCSLFSGHTLHIMPRFHLETYISLVAKYKMPSIFLVPPLPVMMLRQADMMKKYDLSHIERFFIGAAPVSQEVMKEFLKMLPTNVTYLETYGLSESSGFVTYINRTEEVKPHFRGTVGLPNQNVQIKVVDIDTGRTLGPGQRGEVWIKSVQVMKGYLHNPWATAQVLDQQAWLHSGDVGFYDDHGFLYIVDRLKELIKYKGHQVAPAELEDILLSHPAVTDAGVVGMKDAEAGELPCAFVVRRQGAKVTEANLRAYVAERVSPHSRLRGGVRFVSEIPKSASGKILRRKLRDQLNQSRL